MVFDLIRLFKGRIWEIIQEDIRKNNAPISDQMTYVSGDTYLFSVSWEITKNALTADLDISVFIEGLPETDKKDSGVIDVGICIPSQESCNINSFDITIVNWSNSLDTKYDDLPAKIQEIWNCE